MHCLSGFGPSWSCFASGSSTHFGEEIEDDIEVGMASFPELEMVQMGGSDPMVVEPLAIVLPALEGSTYTSEEMLRDRCALWRCFASSQQL
ncbi:hypothetical protein FCV25MIE_15426 [Fagus crenata]